MHSQLSRLSEARGCNTRYKGRTHFMLSYKFIRNSIFLYGITAQFYFLKIHSQPPTLPLHPNNSTTFHPQLMLQHPHTLITPTPNPKLYKLCSCCCHYTAALVTPNVKVRFYVPEFQHEIAYSTSTNGLFVILCYIISIKPVRPIIGTTV